MNQEPTKCTSSFAISLATLGTPMMSASITAHVVGRSEGILIKVKDGEVF